MTATRHIRRLLQSTGAPVEVLEGLSKVERHFLQTNVATLKKQPSIQQFFKSGKNPAALYNIIETIDQCTNQPSALYDKFQKGRCVAMNDPYSTSAHKIFKILKLYCSDFLLQILGQEFQKFEALISQVYRCKYSKVFVKLFLLKSAFIVRIYN